MIGLGLTLAGCGGQEDGNQTVDIQSPAAKHAAARGRIASALPGEDAFQTVCTIDRTTDAEGTVLTARLPDGGFHRFRVGQDGRIVSADGVEPTAVTVSGDRQIEVAVGGARYRLPAAPHRRRDARG
jgi:hypothetical protein